MFQTLHDIPGDIATIRLDSNKPLLLEGNRQIWQVTDGTVELFSIRLHQGLPYGPRRHLCTLQPGDGIICPGDQTALSDVVLLAAGNSGTLLTRIHPETTAPEQVQSLFDGWMQHLATALHLAPESLAKPDDAGPDHHWRLLQQFHTQLFRCISQAEEDEAILEEQRLRQRAEQDEERLSTGLQALSLSDSPWNVLHEHSTDSPLLTACRLIGNELKMTIIAPAASAGERRLRDPLAVIARSSGFRVRRVALKGDWWLHNNGPLLAFRSDENSPVALLQPTPCSYQLHDPVARSAQTVDATVVSELLPYAWMLYRPFPEGPVNLSTLLRFASSGMLNDLICVISVGIVGGLLGLALPILTATVFDGIIPMAHTGQMLQVGLALLVAAVASAFFSATQAIALQRIEGKADAVLQAALVDRLLTLPAGLFRQYQVGDLANRVLGINSIQQMLSKALSSGLFSGISALLNLLLLFWYSRSLAQLVVGLTLLLVFILIGFTFFKLRSIEEQLTLSGRLSGMVFQCISGIAKLKTTAAESRAYISWLALFRKATRVRYRLSLLSGGLTVLHAVYPVLFTMAVFSLFHFRPPQDALSTGQFLSFMAAFGQFTAATVSFSLALMELLPIIPVYQRAEPILRAASEEDRDKADPGDLTGSIEVRGLCFRYQPDGPLILDNLSLQINPGEFVAVVGRSGSGKSTLLRLLLGFETPESGSIYYDSQGIEGLDLRCVRRQIGTVLQDGQLMAGDIYTNIVGSNNLSHDDAWEAARMAGIAEEIKAMPMGMFTMIPPGASTISGGQRQRLLIARAMATRPNIFFFDEATSALDNISQALVGNSLAACKATRLVIAHRLSTIMQADRILVMDQGRIVESGRYDGLMAQQGLFAELARRQML